MNDNHSSDVPPDRRRFVTGGALAGMAGLAALACPSQVAAQVGTGAWYDVTNPAYGALGDGNHNDAPAIQAAIDAMDTTGKGGVLYFPASRKYRLGDATHTPAEIQLRADNMTVLM
jgi:polygalacturonase